MVWFRAWLETRSRIAFTILWLAFFVGVLAISPGRNDAAPTGVLGILAITWLFVPVWLAGSGVRTQAGFGRGATRGLHGSTHFTLSLPVTRARLLLVRGAIGLTATAALIVLMGAAIWLVLPAIRAHVTPFDWVQHLFAVFVCGVSFYGLSTLVAAMLPDDMWHIWSSTLVIMVLWAPPVRRMLPPALDVFRPLIETSPVVTHTLPWTAMAAAAAAGCLLTVAAVKLVQTQEF